MEIIVKELVELAKQLGRQEVRAEFYENKYLESQDDIKKRIERGNKLQSEVNQLTDENADLKEQLKKLKESMQAKQYEKNILEIPEDFILHDGGEHPFTDSKKVVVIYRDGRSISNFSGCIHPWKHSGEDYDIIAYKVEE